MNLTCPAFSACLALCVSALRRGTAFASGPLSGSLRFFLLFSLLLLAGCGHYNHEVTAEPKNHSFKKIVFWGNSLTRHGPAPEVGWYGDWGMAATSLDKDFVHIVYQYLVTHSTVVPDLLQVGNIMPFELDPEHFVFDPLLAQIADSDLVVLEVGDNVPSPLVDNDAFKNGYSRLVGRLAEVPGRQVVLVGNWWANSKLTSDIRSAALQRSNVLFVDITGLDALPQNRGIANDAGVSAHPGDAGMAAIADRIIKGLVDASQ